MVEPDLPCREGQIEKSEDPIEDLGFMTENFLIAKDLDPRVLLVPTTHALEMMSPERQLSQQPLFERDFIQILCV